MKRQQVVVLVIAGLLVLIGLGAWTGAQTSSSKTMRQTTDSASIVVKQPALQSRHHAGNYTKAQALAKIDRVMKNAHIMGTLLITNDGSAGVMTRSYGYADVASAKKNSADEVYPLASLEKAITGTVIQGLINQGKLKMTTPLSRYFPQIPYAKNITMRDLLDHRSGLRMGEPVPASILPNEAAEIKYTVDHLTSTNNHAFAYSNANFTMLAGVIRKVTGRSYMATVRETILKPLGMRHTYAYNQIPINIINPDSYQLTKGYSQSAVISKPLQSSELGAGSLYSSVGDYYKFINGLFTGKLVGKAGFNSLSANQKISYAGGIYYLGHGNVRIGGSDNSFETYYMGTVDAKIGVVLFDNQGVFDGDNSVGFAIQAILAKSDPL